MSAMTSSLLPAVNRRMVPGPAGSSPALAEQSASFVDGQANDLVPVTVAYERHGCGEPLVLLHGAGHHRRAWDPLLPALSAVHETITLDLPGFGQSPNLHPSVPHDLETTVAWMESVFAALGIERPHVVGHSLGGLIALRLGQAGLARSVSALAPAGFWSEAERRYAYALLIMARQGARLLPEAMAARSRLPAGKPACPTDVLNSRFGPCRPEALLAQLCALRETTAFSAILRAGRAPHLFTGDIPGLPVTIAWGTRDRLLPPRQAERVKAQIPAARLVPLPGCGHVPMADAPELVARVLLDTTGFGTAPRGDLLSRV
ncbi:alpha/beta fold hydrolase [Streptomyces sp. ZAF1911]|nr:alpha/beta fold hydrolase [Streptomyces sp. ZAF1911]MDD9380393.1 alpha/beta fold hydrolase [Streptomyces sp. ZAF1911]